MVASPASDVVPTRLSPRHNWAPATGAPTSSTTETVNGAAPLARLHPAQVAQTRERATSSRKHSLRDKMGKSYRLRERSSLDASYRSGAEPCSSGVGRPRQNEGAQN